MLKKKCFFKLSQVSENISNNIFIEKICISGHTVQTSIAEVSTIDAKEHILYGFHLHEIPEQGN